MKTFLLIILPLIIIGGAIFLYSILAIIPEEMEDEIEILDFDDETNEEENDDEEE